MNPYEMNAAIAAITNWLYANLSKKDFFFLSVVLSEMSKSMFSMEILRGICRIEEHAEEHKEHTEEKKS